MHRSFFLVALLLMAGTVSMAQASSDNEARLAQADSLYKMRKYTESFALYDSLLTRQKVSSPAMLLKMAFINEGLKQYDQSLYYLNLYYLRTNNREALDKMEELADARGLRGYEADDAEFFKTIFFRYHTYLVYFLLALGILFLSIAYYRKFRMHESPLIPALAMVVTLVVLFYTLNFSLSYKRGIVSQNDTYLMESPSSSSDVLAIIKKGHRLDIEGQTDVWIRTTWDNRTVYLKANKLRAIGN